MHILATKFLRVDCRSLRFVTKRGIWVWPLFFGNLGNKICLQGCIYAEVSALQIKDYKYAYKM